MSTEEITIGDFHGIPVGRGGFATVYRMADNRGNIVALKLADQDADAAIRASLYHEFTVQSEMIHPQIVRAHRFGLHGQCPYIVLDWVDGAELFERFSSPTADDFTIMLRQIADVLYFIHHRGWVHGDLKPENFRWRTQAVAHSPELCVLDFGLARRIGDVDRPRGAGTVGYCAPEFLNNQPADGRADWYAIGIMLYEWIFGVRPYAADEPAIEIAGHLEGAPDFDRPRCRPAPEWADQLIFRLLAKTPDARADDEMSLLVLLAEHDPMLDPTRLLNAQLQWHAKSESRRLRHYEETLLECVSDDLRSGHPAILSINSHGRASDAWLERAAGLCAKQGYEVTVNIDDQFVSFLRDASPVPDCEPRIHIRYNCRLSAPTADCDAQPLRAISLLPWDRTEVREYLNGIIGDGDVAEAWTDAVLLATCGLPTAVAALTRDTIEDGALSVDADGWGLDESAVVAWRDHNLMDQIARVFGAPGSSEVLLCQWLALGEGQGASSILDVLWDKRCDPLVSTLNRLIARGLIVRDASATPGTFDLRLRLAGHAEILLSTLSADDIRNRSRSLAHELDSRATGPAGVRSEVLGHAYARAEVWEKSAAELLLTATSAIKSDDRERAMRYIGLAQGSASRIAEPVQRAHWLGQSRMVEGDLQKAMGQLDAARRIYRELLVLSRASKDRRLLAETLHDLSDLYYVIRRFYKGISSERSALRIWERLGDRAQVSRSLNSLGNLHWISGELQCAREYYQRALAIQTELGLKQYAATNLNNLGLIFWKEHNFPEAESHFRQALEIHERLGNAVEVARCLNNLGTINFERGMPDNSESYYTRAATLNAQAGARSEEMFNRWNLVDVALELGDVRSAVTLGHAVLDECIALGENATAAEVAAQLSDGYFRAGDDRRAWHFHDLCAQTALTLTNDDLRMHLALQLAARHRRFNRPHETLDVLARLTPGEATASVLYRRMDIVALQAEAHALMSDAKAIASAWDTGSRIAASICAPHKKMQLACACIPGMPDSDDRARLCAEATEFLATRPRWHWAPNFHLWRARRLILTGDWQAALDLLVPVAAELRQNANGEQLWRSMAIIGLVYSRLADYAEAMNALGEAENLLKAVLSTVDDKNEKRDYLECHDARVLQETKAKIMQLVS